MAAESSVEEGSPRDEVEMRWVPTGDPTYTGELHPP